MFLAELGAAFIQAIRMPKRRTSSTGPSACSQARQNITETRSRRVRIEPGAGIAFPAQMLFPIVLALCGLPAARAAAENPRSAVQQSLRHMEERLLGLLEAGNLHDQMPVLVASVSSLSPENETWFVPYAMRSLVGVFGPGNMRVCNICMKTEVAEKPGLLSLRRKDWSTRELVSADQKIRQQSQPAKSALYVHETRNVVSVRVVSLDDARIIFAANFDPDFSALRRSENIRRYHVELKDRRAGAGHTHFLWDGILYPNQHLALDILDQFGERGQHLAGISTSMFTPLLGVGFAYHYVFQDAWNVSLGTKVLFAGPNLLLRVLFEEDLELVDPLINTVFVLRVPIPETNLAVSGMIATGSDSFPFPTQSPTLGVGLTLLNPTLMPVFP